MDRLISEQAVFKIIDNLKVNFTCFDSVTLDEVASHIKAIPSAEPSGDLISRQAVDTLVDELARAISDERCCISRGRSTATIMQDILDLPSVNPTSNVSIQITEREKYGRFN